MVEAFFGDDWYIGERYTGPRIFPTPPEWAAFPGHYRANHAWFNNFRLVLRKGELRLVSPQGDEWAVTPAGDGAFWAGESGEPPREQLSFDTVVRGKTLRCVLSGLSYYRTFTP